MFFSKFTKEKIIEYLKSPEINEKYIRDACIYLYNVSSHFKRLVQYFSKIDSLDYIVVPYKLDTKNVNKNKFLKQYKQVLDLLETMNLKHELIKVLTTAYREDVFYGYEYSTEDSYFIRKLNPDYCKISTIEDGVYNFAYDFSYFNSRKDKLEQYGEEFVEKYNNYEKDSKLRWQELDSGRTICIKINEDIDYVIPPFVGVLEAIYDLQDYKLLKKIENQNDNYKILNCIIPTDEKTGEMLLKENLAMKYFKMIEKAVPDGIGVSLSPLKIESFTFSNNSTAERDAVAQATAQVWSSAGVSELIFNDTSAGSTGLLQSIRSDIDVSKSVIRQIERWINRKLKNLDKTYRFKIHFLNVSIYNQKEMFDMYLSAGNAGVPVKSAVAAILGYSPSDIVTMSFLENDVLKMRDTMFGEPLLSSHTMTSDEKGGRPPQDTVDDKGQKTRDTEGNDR